MIQSVWKNLTGLQKAAEHLWCDFTWAKNSSPNTNDLYIWVHLFHTLQNCCNRDGNTIFKYIHSFVAPVWKCLFSSKGANTFVHITNAQVIGVWWWVFVYLSPCCLVPEIFVWHWQSLDHSLQYEPAASHLSSQIFDLLSSRSSGEGARWGRVRRGDSVRLPESTCGKCVSGPSFSLVSPLPFSHMHDTFNRLHYDIGTTISQWCLVSRTVDHFGWNNSSMMRNSCIL